MLNDMKVPTNTYWEKPPGNPSMNLRRTRSLCIEIYKTINNFNLELMKNLFKAR